MQYKCTIAGLKTVMLFAHKTLKSGEIYQYLDFYALLFLFISLFLHKYLKHLETGFKEPQKKNNTRKRSMFKSLQHNFSMYWLFKNYALEMHSDV